MRSSGVRWVVLGGIIALSVIWLGIRPGRRATRPAATVDSAAEPAEHGSRLPSAARVAPAERRESPSEEARAAAPAAAAPAPTAGVRASRRAGGAARRG